MRFINYAKNAYTELVQKVSWPSWSQLSNSAVIVMIASLLIAVVVLVMDIAFENLMKAIYNILY
ncbi:MAG TPA: preprotein translocase subunit SecE [Candidatus Alistipes merdigallinarum]|nr:preprotein translocase subunit SecE [Candidatus Alistipes pullicola]HJB85310.1 preprotein translocase subunit SecE [Candidatus Alistipes merdigallinarum]